MPHDDRVRSERMHNERTERTVDEIRPVPTDELRADGAGPDGDEFRAVIETLSRAGARARADLGAATVSPAFAAALRARLLAGYGSATPVRHGEPAPAGGAGSTRAARPERAAVEPRPIVPARGFVRPRWTAGRWRWLPLAAAAALVVGLVAGIRPVSPDEEYRAAEVAGAELIRAGTARPLLSSDVLRVGDTVAVAPAGHATLELGPVIVRLAGGAAVRIVGLEAGRVAIEQTAGRVYHRVVGSVAYAVQTGPLTWTADGTAFDLAWTTGGAGDSAVRLLAVEHAVEVDGPGLEIRIDEGRLATVTLGSLATTVRSAGPADLVDPWLVANARLDDALGFGLGILGDLGELAHGSPSPTPVATPDEHPEASGESEPSPEPSAEPSHGASPTPAPTEAPTPKPTATPKPTPKPTATPAPQFGMSVTGCDGGVVIAWSKYTEGAFNHYSTYRSTSSFGVPDRYPPEWPIEYLDATYTTDKAKTSAADTTGEPGRTYYYRALVFDAADRVIAASGLASAKAGPVRDLGGIGVVPADAGTRVSWTPYPGSSACFTTYVVVWSASSTEPSYFGSHDGLVGVATKSASSTVLADLHSGSTYWIRVQVIRATALGAFLVAESAVAEYSVP